MSVWKETWYEVEDLIKKQTQIYEDAADYGVIIRDDKNPNRALRDKHFVDRVRDIIRENKKYATITKDDHRWTMELECLEAEEDGRKIGALVIITHHKYKQLEYVSLDMRDLNQVKKIYKEGRFVYA